MREWAVYAPPPPPPQSLEERDIEMDHFLGNIRPSKQCALESSSGRGALNVFTVLHRPSQLVCGESARLFIMHGFPLSEIDQQFNTWQRIRWRRLDLRGRHVFSITASTGFFFA